MEMKDAYMTVENGIVDYNFPNCIDQLSLDFFRSASGFLYNWCHIRLR
jgi:hypothetical protein